MLLIEFFLFILGYLVHGAKVEVESNAKKITQSSKNADKSEAGSNTKTTDVGVSFWVYFNTC